MEQTNHTHCLCYNPSTCNLSLLCESQYQLQDIITEVHGRTNTNKKQTNNKTQTKQILTKYKTKHILTKYKTKQMCCCMPKPYFFTCRNVMLCADEWPEAENINLEIFMYLDSVTFWKYQFRDFYVFRFYDFFSSKISKSNDQKQRNSMFLKCFTLAQWWKIVATKWTCLPHIWTCFRLIKQP